MARRAAPQPPDTVVAIATPPGRGGVGVVRLSGPNLAPYALALTGRPHKPRHAGFVRFRSADGSVIDEGIAIFFPAPHSFTGEDVFELQGHGGPVVMQLLVERCIELGARLAEPGEFSRRAFVNGRIDLAQAEAVADLIAASTAAGVRSAVRSLTGEFSHMVNRLSDELIDLRMLVEATLDFPEEEVAALVEARFRDRVGRIRTELVDVLAQAQRGALLRNGLRVVLVGRPNVGKSSLMNALAGEERAIVTEIAGTTRDAIRETIQIEGIPVHVVDTAGLRRTEDPIERIGVERAWREIAEADVALVLVEAGDAGHSMAAREIDAQLPIGLERIRVVNKIDLCGLASDRIEQGGVVEIRLSAKQGDGVDLLRRELLRVAGWCVGEDAVGARERHLVALRAALGHVDATGGCGEALELVAEELRLAHEALGVITGEFTPDDLLGVIFSRFCIGK